MEESGLAGSGQRLSALCAGQLVSSEMAKEVPVGEALIVRYADDFVVGFQYNTRPLDKNRAQAVTTTQNLLGAYEWNSRLSGWPPTPDTVSCWKCL